MRIATYASHLSRSAGGLYYSVSGLSRAVAEKGHEVAVFGGADHHFEADRAIWDGLDVRAYAMPTGGYGLHPRILGDILAFQPDIVHIQGIWSATSIYGRAATMRNIPVVASPRGMLDPWILARKPLIKRVHAALFEGPMMARAHIHALSESERVSIAAFMPRAANRTFVIPNGIPPVDAAEEDIPRSGALFIGRLHAKKQTLELIDLWQSTPALAPHPLTIAGWGEKSYQDAVSEKAASAENVRFVGSLYGEEKTAALRAAKFFILPSLSEGLPVAVLEAIQYGAVPIITDQCNLPELFENGVALRMETDFSDFAKVAEQSFAMADTQVRELSGRAKAFAAHYRWSNIAARMVEQYEKVCST